MADSYGAAPIIEAGLNEITFSLENEAKASAQQIDQAGKNLTSTVKKIRKALIEMYSYLNNQTLSRSNILRQPGNIFDIWGPGKNQHNFKEEFFSEKMESQSKLQMQIEALTYEFSHNFVTYLKALNMFDLKTPKLVYIWHSADYNNIEIYEEKNINDDKKASILANAQNLEQLLGADNKFLVSAIRNPKNKLMKQNKDLKNTEKYAVIQSAYKSSTTRSKRKGTHGRVLTLWVQDGAWAKALVNGWGFFAEAFMGFVYAAQENPESLTGLFESIDREILVGDFMTGSPSNVRSNLFATKKGDKLNEEFQKNQQGVMTGDSAPGALIGDRGYRQAKSLGSRPGGIADLISFMKILDTNYQNLEQIVKENYNLIYTKFIEPKGFQNSVAAYEGSNWATAQIDLDLERQIKNNLSAYVDI